MAYGPAHRFYRDLRVRLLHESPNILEVQTDAGFTGREVLAALERKAVLCDQGLNSDVELSIEDRMTIASVNAIDPLSTAYQKKRKHLAPLRSVARFIDGMCQSAIRGDEPLGMHSAPFGMHEAEDAVNSVAESIVWADSTERPGWGQLQPGITAEQRAKLDRMGLLRQALQRRVEALVDDFKRNWLFR